MSDIMAMDPAGATQLRQRMEGAADELDWDAQALAGPLAEAAELLGGEVPDVPRGLRRVADELRDSALDLRERTQIVLAGGSEMNEGLGALERIRDHFTLIESRGRSEDSDGILSRHDLLWARSHADSDTATAAAWLLDHESFFAKVETAKHNDDYLENVFSGEFAFDSEDRDDRMTLDDIDAFLDKTSAWSTLLPVAGELDTAHAGGAADGFISRDDLEAYLRLYNPSPEVAAAVRQVLDDRAYHRGDGGGGLAAMLDVVSFVPVVGDIVDGTRSVYYALHGDFATASLFALALVPLPGLSSSGVRGAIKVVEAVKAAARTSGTKAAVKEAAQRGVKGTAANYGAYESTKRTGEMLGNDLDIDESIDYALDDVLGDRIEDKLGDKLDPQLRRLLADRLEASLENRLSANARAFLTETNQVITRRIAEHHATEFAWRGLPSR